MGQVELFPHPELLRAAISDEIERLIALLDALDADSDLEDDGTAEAEPDDEAGGDDEPWLGWLSRPDTGTTWTGGTDDMEAAS